MEFDVYTDGSCMSQTELGCALPKTMRPGSYAFIIQSQVEYGDEPRDVFPNLRDSEFVTDRLAFRDTARCILSPKTQYILVPELAAVPGNTTFFGSVGQCIGNTTRNLELLAVMKALQAIPVSSSVRLHCDSRFVQRLLDGTLVSALPKKFLRQNGCDFDYLNETRSIEFHKAGKMGGAYWQHHLCHMIAKELTTQRRQRNERKNILNQDTFFTMSKGYSNGATANTTRNGTQ